MINKLFIITCLLILLNSSGFCGNNTASDYCEACQKRKQAQLHSPAFPVKEGMSKDEVIKKIGTPYYIVGQKDPFFLERKQEQKEKYGYVMEVWYYKFPKKFVIYLKNAKVSSFRDLAAAELIPE